jgi:glucosyl-dolichyl phosphate glucuronosyltransferase
MCRPEYLQSEMIDISVIVATYNRCQFLAKTLHSVADSTLPESVEWEVLVVDNNSHDQTREVVGEFCSRYPGRFRYVFEPQPGKSNALNRGVREARGQVLAFTDDDVRVEPMWLQNVTAALFDGEWAGCGGPVVPKWADSPPPWLPLRERCALAPLPSFDPGLNAGPLTEPPFGANMAFRRDVFERHGGFRTDLGPKPTGGVTNEDTEFGRRLLAAGEQLRYEPSAIIHHPVPPNRMQKRYFLAWWFNKARAEVRESGIPTDVKLFVAGIPLVYIRRLAVWTVRWLVAVGPVRRFSSKINVWFVAGEILECSRQSTSKRRRRERSA